MRAVSKIFYCGPLAVKLKGQDPNLIEKFEESLKLYDVTWEKSHMPVSVTVKYGSENWQMAKADFLTLQRMNVTLTPDGLHAICKSGCSCHYAVRRDEWVIHVPVDAPKGWEVPTDIDHLVSLVLTTGWRRAGWVPLHAGAIIRSSCCAIVCAPSGAGKTTLVAAMIRLNWKTLGDDKLLLRINDEGLPELAALVHTLNLDPKTKRWFPEARIIDSLPPYSPFTDKRRVPIEQLWPNRVNRTAKPTHLLHITRRDDIDLINVRSMKNGEVLSTLLHQTVIPEDVTMARGILSTIASTAAHLTGFSVEVGCDAYNNPNCLVALEDALSD